MWNLQPKCNSVSNALLFCENLVDYQFKEIESTAKFYAPINNAFDILNCHTEFSENPYNLGLDHSKINKYSEFIAVFEKYISGLKWSYNQNIVVLLQNRFYWSVEWFKKCIKFIWIPQFKICIRLSSILQTNTRTFGNICLVLLGWKERWAL